ncbi:MAG: hypothetical protein Q9167_002300 [Letrouitia subvulpina]
MAIKAADRTMSLIEQPLQNPPDYCYGHSGSHKSTLTTSEAFAPWQNSQSTSSYYHQPTFYSHGFEYSKKDVQDVFGSGVVFAQGGKPQWESGSPQSVPASSLSPRHCSIRQSNNEKGSHGYHSPVSSLNILNYPTPPLDSANSPRTDNQSKMTSIPRGSLNQLDMSRPIGSEDTSTQSTTGTPYLQDFNFSNEGHTGSKEQEERTCLHTMNDEESDDGGSINSEPYAQLIFRALKSAPGYRMVLKDIYDWFERNTDKAKNGPGKGWQNSIRHNLSMNGAFRKVDQAPANDDSKKGNIWVLEASALGEGVKSTTRYRKSPSNRRLGRNEYPTPKRQRSGAKGGKAAKKTEKVRRSTHLEVPSLSPFSEDIPMESIESSVTEMGGLPLTPTSVWAPDELHYYFGSSSPSIQPTIMDRKVYSYNDIVGVTPEIPPGPLFPDDFSQSNEALFSCHSFEAGEVLLNNSLDHRS